MGGPPGSLGAWAPGWEAGGAVVPAPRCTLRLRAGGVERGPPRAGGACGLGRAGEGRGAGRGAAGTARSCWPPASGSLTPRPGASSGEPRPLSPSALPLAPGNGPRQAPAPAGLVLPAAVARAARSRCPRNVCRRRVAGPGGGARNPPRAAVKRWGRQESFLLQPLRGF